MDMNNYEDTADDSFSIMTDNFVFFIDYQFIFDR
jgi:hypothetical protein